MTGKEECTVYTQFIAIEFARAAVVQHEASGGDEAPNNGKISPHADRHRSLDTFVFAKSQQPKESAQ